MVFIAGMMVSNRLELRFPITGQVVLFAPEYSELRSVIFEKTMVSSRR